MQINITVKSHDSGKTDSIKNYAAEQFSRIQDFLNREDWSPVQVEMVAHLSPTHAHQEFELLVKCPHFTVMVKKQGEDLYQVINKVMDVALADLHEHKRKWVDKKKAGDGFHR